MTEIFELFIAQMTETQGRRYRLYWRGWTMRRIARQEGISVVSIRESLRSGEKRAKKCLQSE